MTGPPSVSNQGRGDPSADAALRVLIVTHLFWPEEFRINDLASDLHDRGYHVTVATGYPNYPGHRIFPNFSHAPKKYGIYGRNITVERFLTIGVGSSKPGLILNYLSLAVAMTFSGPWRLRERKFDAIVCFQPSPFTIVLPAIVLAKLKRAPLILWVLDCWPETLEAIGIVRRPALIRALGVVVGYAYRRCAMVLGQSRSFGASIARWSGRPDLFGHFPNWVEDVYAGVGAAVGTRSDGTESRPFTVMFAGNIGEAQDFRTVVQAMVALRYHPIRWVIVGGGRMEGWLREEIGRCGLDNVVDMLGRKPTEQMPALYAQADALLVSLAAKPVFAMTVPGKVQSYMAAGKPIAGVLDGEGAALIAEARCGLTASAGDHRGLAEAIVELSSMSAADRARMGENGRTFAAAHFGREAILDRFNNWLRATIDRSRHHNPSARAEAVDHRANGLEYDQDIDQQ